MKTYRKNNRLKNYDYSNNGAYFITICTYDRKCLFGEIIGNEMNLNNAGQMIFKWWKELENKFMTIELDEFLVMPNHLHGIIKIVCSASEQTKLGEHIGSPLHTIIQWFKTMTTNDYIRNVKQHNWQPFHNRLWQRGFYDHIIRNEKDMQEIRQYIINNSSSDVGADLCVCPVLNNQANTFNQVRACPLP